MRTVTETTSKIRTRYAPSPTGELHLGGLRTALYAWLWARHNNGSFYIRIEDTDRERYVVGAADRMLATLRGFGITWDEGPDIGGPHTPYVQSERLNRYREAAERLVAEGKAYNCDCSMERLSELRKTQIAAGQPTRYDGRCRNRQKEINLTEPHVIRFRTPTPGDPLAPIELVPTPDASIGTSETAGTQEDGIEDLTVSDLIHGDITVKITTIDDFVLLKSDGFPTYHLAHIVDDHEMATTDVIRGDEWISSLPRHVLLFRAFGWEPPRYAHLPLLLNAQRKKLSKRDEDVSVDSFLTWCLPRALINFVALLGCNPSNNQEIYSTEELIATFDLKKVNRSPAVVDLEKLEWMNGEYIRQLSPAELLDLVQEKTGYYERINDSDRWRLRGDSDREVDTNFLLKVMGLEQPRLKRLSLIPSWYFRSYNREAPLIWKNADVATTSQNLEALITKLAALEQWNGDATPAELEVIIKSWIVEHKMGVGETLWPMRVALSGQQASPSPFELAWLFGREETLRRLRYALASLN
ncbi:MAG: glutamate--tRNA ligase family protein [Candidatus Uhrbacteria bacterium]